MITTRPSIKLSVNTDNIYKNSISPWESDPTIEIASPLKRYLIQQKDRIHKQNTNILNIQNKKDIIKNFLPKVHKKLKIGEVNVPKIQLYTPEENSIQFPNESKFVSSRDFKSNLSSESASKIFENQEKQDFERPNQLKSKIIISPMQENNIKKQNVNQMISQSNQKLYQNKLVQPIPIPKNIHQYIQIKKKQSHKSVLIITEQMFINEEKAYVYQIPVLRKNQKGFLKRSWKMRCKTYTKIDNNI